MKILATDIGGTNSRLAILNGTEIERVEIYPTNSFKSISELFDRFKEDCEELPKLASIASAGVVEDDQIKGTNHPWIINKKELTEKFGFEKCLLLNDFEAAAWGLLVVKSDSLIQIGGDAPDPLGNKAILGAGTGLGEAILCFATPKWHVARTEGGHCNFAPNSERQMELLTFLWRKKRPVTYESVLSGRGLERIYEFLTGRAHSDISPEKITKNALQGDETCMETVLLFCNIYGQEAGNLALKSFSTGGVYLYGGIVGHIIPILMKSNFRQAFEDKGPMKPLMKKIPVFIINEPYLALRGGAYKLLEATMPKSS